MQLAADLIAYIKSRPCVDCGQKFIASAMEFDHRDATEKVASISALASIGTLQGVVKEILKCDVVCANCHRVRTKQRAKGGAPGKLFLTRASEIKPKPRTTSKTDVAQSWLEGYLREYGPTTSKEVKEAAQRAGFQGETIWELFEDDDD